MSGGSHAINAHIRALMIKAGRSNQDIECLMREFEERKHMLDFSDSASDMLLSPPGVRPFQISRGELDRTYENTFKKALRGLVYHVTQILAKEQDVAVVLNGGSFSEPWVQDAVKFKLRRLNQRLQAEPIPEGKRRALMRYVIMPMQDINALGAVAAGAALSFAHVPDSHELVRRSTFALQRRSWDEDTEVYVGEDVAYKVMDKVRTFCHRSWSLYT